MNQQARDLINHLQLQPHPEGGWYRETYRHTADDGSRGDQTAIFFLLEKGQSSHWHRIDAVEMWHWYAGSPLKLKSHDGVKGEEVILGPDVLAGQTPQYVIPKQHWQAANAEEGWCLVGCTVAPAFSFDGFELASPEWSPA
ncbi:cupin domain-containing protein [Kiloniella laminariae]|uniref:cupin domain-containing protein n=1 Tax=Kiloniella laminariae TaxID=454162 RepID=UPI00037EC133|nr:cupin domain-containing protein [Kiloniella laminariae]